jgi:hypothetical protein
MPENDRTKPHPFVGKFPVCMLCYKAEKDSIHDLVAAASVPDVIKAYDITPTTPAFQEAAIKDFEIFKPLPLDDPDDPGDFDLEITEPTSIPEPVAQQVTEPLTTVQGDKLCKGHQCAECGQLWYHEYDCGRKKQDALCLKCAQQAAADINRPQSIQQIAESDGIISGVEAVARMMQVESTVYNMIYEPVPSGLSGESQKLNKLREDWQELIYNHIKDCQRKIELFKLDIQGASKIRMAKLTEEVQKLSPEDVAILRKRAGKIAAGKKVKSDSEKDAKPTAKPEPKLDKDAARKKLYDTLLAGIRGKNPGLTPDELAAKTQRKLEILETE